MTESGTLSSGIAAKAFCEAVYEEQDWIDNYSFRFRGITRERGEHKLMIFFLDEPQIVASKATKKAAELVAEEQKTLASRYHTRSTLGQKSRRNGKNVPECFIA